MAHSRLARRFSALTLLTLALFYTGCSQQNPSNEGPQHSGLSSASNPSPAVTPEQSVSQETVSPLPRLNLVNGDATEMHGGDGNDASRPSAAQTPGDPAAIEPLSQDSPPSDDATPIPPARRLESNESKSTENELSMSELDFIRMQFIMHNSTSSQVIDSLRSVVDRMPTVPIAVGDAPTRWQQVRNYANSATLNSGKHRICLFKFRSPLEVPANLHWSFAISGELGEWNLLPARGETKGFTSFKYERHIQVADVPLEPGNLFVFQELTEGRILPGEDYIIWYLPPDGVETAPWVTMCLTEAGSHPPGKSSEEICQILKIKTEKPTFPQNELGLQAAFRAAHLMSTVKPVDRQGAREVLRSVWEQLPLIEVSLAGAPPIWNAVRPDPRIAFHAARFRSPAQGISDVNWCMVTKNSLPNWGFASRFDKIEATNAYGVELNSPLSGISNPEENLAMFQNLPGGQIRPNEEYALLWATSEERLEDMEVAVSLAPSPFDANSDEQQEVLSQLQTERRNQFFPYRIPSETAAAMGIQIPETPSSERVDAALTKCRDLIANGHGKSWLLTHLLFFAAPGLPVLKTESIPPDWTDIRLNEGGRPIAAFRIDPDEMERGRLALALVRPNSTISQFNLPRIIQYNNVTDRRHQLRPILSWGITSDYWPGIFFPFRSTTNDASQLGINLPRDCAVDADIYSDHRFSQTNPLVVVICPPDTIPIDVKIAGLLEADQSGFVPTDVATIITYMGFQNKLVMNEGQILIEHEKPATIARFFEPGVAVVSGSSGNELKWWVDLPDIKVPTYSRGTQGRTLAFSADRTKLAAINYDDQTITIHHAGTLEELQQLKIPDARIPQSLSFSPQADRLFASYGGHFHMISEGIYRNSVHYVWDLSKPEAPPLTREYPLSAAIETGLWLSDGRIVVAGISDVANFRNMMLTCKLAPSEISFLDSTTLETKEIIKGEGDDWIGLAESGDGTRLGAVARTGWVTVWDSKSLLEIASLPIAMQGRKLSLSKDGRRVAVLGDKVQVWSVDDGRILSCGRGQLPDADDASLSPNGDKLVLACNDGTVRLYDVREFPDADARGDNPLNLTDSTQMTFSFIPAGSFMMGRSPEKMNAIAPAAAGQFDDQSPRHEVMIKRPFYMGQHEVTVAQFRKFVEETGFKTTAEKNGRGGALAVPTTRELRDDPRLNWKNPGFGQKDDHPVVQVSYEDALAFCDWMSQKENTRYRLPTEAEWEYACRAATETAAFYGWVPWMYRCANVPDAELSKIYGAFNGACSLSDGHAYSAPVGSYKPNGYGLYDMSGNVWEWCSDWYDPQYYAKSPAEDPTGPPEGVMRVQRGGCFYHGFGQSSERDYGPPDQTQFMLGFRVVREVE